MASKGGETLDFRQIRNEANSPYFASVSPIYPMIETNRINYFAHH